MITVITFLSQVLFAQTPGMIIEPAGTAAEQLVLDPDGNGYASKTTAGFLGDDRLNSEIAFKTLIPAGEEPAGDVRNGPDCGFTDFVESVSGGIDPAFHYSNSTHWLFRLRMSDIKPNAKSYSILIDIDGKIGTESAAYVQGENPGFEIEIVLSTKFGVRIYDLRENCGSNLVKSYNEKRYQKVIAASRVCDKTNFFLDFFVDWADITSAFGIDEESPMRYAIVSNIAADKSSICNSTSASDLGGVDDSNCGSLFNCYTEVLEIQPVCPPNSAEPCVFSDCPSISTTLIDGTTTVAGTSTEADGTIILVYVSGEGSSPYATTVIEGLWSVSVNPLILGAQVYATALADGKVESGTNCNNSVTVTDACSIRTPAPLSGHLSNVPGSKGIRITLTAGTLVAGSEIRAYNPNGTLVDVIALNLVDGSSNPIITTAALQYNFECKTGNCFPNGVYYVTYTQLGECESFKTPFCIGVNTPTALPILSTTPVLVNASSLTGTMTSPDNVANVNIMMFVNGIQKHSTLTTAGGAWTFSGLSLKACDEIYFQAIAPGKCISGTTASVTVGGGQTSAPLLFGPYCGTTSIVSGTSTAPNGTTITVYLGTDTSNPLGTATVNGGAWTASLSPAITGGQTITARAQNTNACQTQSGASASVSIENQTSITASVTSPVLEQSTSVSGTSSGGAGNTVNLFIDGYPVYQDLAETILATAVTAAGGSWTVNAIYNESLYAGGEIQARVIEAGFCGGTLSPKVLVSCIEPIKTLTINPDATAVCTNNIVANVEIENSQPGVIYQLYIETNPTGSSLLGNDGTITLSTSPLTTNSTISVRAIKAPYDNSCNSILDETVTVTVNNIPDSDLSIDAVDPTICAGVSTNIRVYNSQTNVEYELRNKADDSPIGTNQDGDGNTLTFNTGTINVN